MNQDCEMDVVVEPSESSESSEPSEPQKGNMDYLAKLNAHPRDQHIRFFEEGHIYEIYGQRGQYTSVTTWNHSLFSHFDAEACVAKIVKNSRWKNDPGYKYHQMSAEAIKLKWDVTRDEASRAGTLMHLNIEQYYNGLDVQNDSIEFTYFRNFLADFPQLEPYRTEWCVFHEELKLSGSIDMVFRDRDTGEFLIYDWKRSKEIEYEPAYGKKTSHVPCLSDMPDCNFWHYSLQLNTYRYILETKYNMTISGMYLIVLHPENYPKTYDRVKVHDLRHKMDDIWAYRQSIILDVHTSSETDIHTSEPDSESEPIQNMDTAILNEPVLECSRGLVIVHPSELAN